MFEHVALFPLALRFFWGVVPPRQKINIKRGALRHRQNNVRARMAKRAALINIYFTHMRFALCFVLCCGGFRVLLDCGLWVCYITAKSNCKKQKA